VFDNLIESKPKKGPGGFTSTFFSIALHAVVITGAVYVTLQAGESVIEERQIDVTLQVQQQKKAEEQKQEVAPVPQQIKGFQTLSIPTSIPVDIPPPSTQEFNAADFSGVGVEGGIASGRQEERQVIRQDQPYLEAVVEERPERVSSPLARYPDILRQAGIEGRVLIEVVIDTSGHAERGTIRVLTSTHQLFEGPAREVVQNSLYSPGRIQGRAVRVRVQVPINFNILRAGQQNP
jgi:protein TonB